LRAIRGIVPGRDPDPEVVAQAKRRRFTAEYKQRILAAVEQTKGSGGTNIRYEIELQFFTSAPEDVCFAGIARQILGDPKGRRTGPTVGSRRS
jgi:hypothetical protein